MSVAERRYAMIRVRAGDYLLPSNDTQTLWRITSYAEDGTLVHVLPDGSERVVLGTFWQTAKCNRRDWLDLNDYDMLDWDHWDHWAMGFRTRRAAVEDALRGG